MKPMNHEEQMEWYNEIKQLKCDEPNTILILQLMVMILQYALSQGKVLNRTFLRKMIDNVKAGKPIFKKI